MNAVLGFTTIIEKEADNPAKVRDCAGKIMACLLYTSRCV